MPSECLRIATSSPATVANLGAGFDCLALAVDLRNEYDLYFHLDQQVTAEDNIPEFTINDPFAGPYGMTDRRMRTLNQNLFVLSFKHTRRLLCNKAGLPIPHHPCLVKQRVNIPPVRGLGSSSSACVAGVLAGIEFIQAKYPEIDIQELVRSFPNDPIGDHQIHEIQATLANHSDSNPDNVCAALVGGLTYCYGDENPADYRSATSEQRLHFFRDAVEDETLRCLALVPSKELSTPHARQILASERYKLDDVVFNMQRAVSIPRIFRERRYELLREVTKDRIHQEQRARVLYTNDRGRPIDIWFAFQAVMDMGGYCAFISGSGSTLVALAHSSKAQDIMQVFRDAFIEVAPDDWKVERMMTLRHSNLGATSKREYLDDIDQLDDVDQLDVATHQRGLEAENEHPGDLAAASVFISYAREDKDMCQKLCNHLGGLKNGGLIKEWVDRQIIPGQEWKAEIVRQLERADIILLLVSSSFFGSKFIEGVELERALERHNRGDAIVIPVILKPVYWESVKRLRRLQALPTGGKPISSWSDREAGYVDVARGVGRAVESWRSRRR